MMLTLPSSFTPSSRNQFIRLFYRGMANFNSRSSPKTLLSLPKNTPDLLFRVWRGNSRPNALLIRSSAAEEGLQLFIELDNMPSTAPVLLLLLVVLVQTDFTDSSVTSDSVKVYRQMVYEQTQERIDKLNAAFGDTYTSVHNQYSYLTPEEFRAQRTGAYMSPPGSPMRVFVNDLTEDEDMGKVLRDGPHMNAQALINHILPNNGVFSIDYSDSSLYNMVTSVKNQGTCGSCWAFASIAEIESLYLYRHKMYLDLSEQQMVDCMNAVDSNTNGCNGGMIDSVEFYAAQYNIVEEKYYPYVEKDQTCNQARINSVGGFKINGYNYIKGCTQMASTLLATRPLAVGGVVDDQWQNYGSGVVTTCNVGTVGGHAILLVGVASDGTQNTATNYFKYKNQWGYNWGMNGYINLYRDYKNQTGMCGYCSGLMSY